MSGIARKMKRSMLKERYLKFSAAWHQEQDYQRYLLDNGEAKISDTVQKFEDGRVLQYLEGKDGERAPLLGHKPTFKQWMAAYENQKNVVKITPAQTDQVQVEETEWEE